MSENNEFSFENPQYRKTYWHTCSHVMAQARTTAAISTIVSVFMVFLLFSVWICGFPVNERERQIQKKPSSLSALPFGRTCKDEGISDSVAALPRYHSACRRKSGRSSAARCRCAGKRDPVTEASVPNYFCLSFELLAGDNFSAPCCRLARPAAF